MQFTAKQIADILNGIIEGDENVKVSTLSKIEEGEPGSLCFISNPKYENFLYKTAASVVIVAKSFKPSQAFNSTLIKVDDPYSAFSMVLEKYNEFLNASQKQSGIDPSALVDSSAVLEEGVYVGPFCYVGPNVKIAKGTQLVAQNYIGADSSIGANCVFYPGVRVYKESNIGNRVIIHSNSVIGSDGFGFAPQSDGSYNKIAQIGNVIIEDDVEIGANTTIDRATMGSTIIRKGVKLDNLIQIAHNVELGAHTVVAAQTGISGSTKVGEHSLIGGQVGIAGHLNLARKTQIGAKAGINFDTEENKQWHGSPAQPLKEWMRSSVIFRKLPDVDRKVREMESKINELTALIEKITTTSTK